MSIRAAWHSAKDYWPEAEQSSAITGQLIVWKYEGGFDMEFQHMLPAHCYSSLLVLLLVMTSSNDYQSASYFIARARGANP